MPAYISGLASDKILAQRFMERRKAVDRAIHALEKYQSLISQVKFNKSRKVRSKSAASQVKAAAA